MRWSWSAARGACKTPALQVWRDVERRAAGYGLPFAGIPPYPIKGLSGANRIVLGVFGSPTWAVGGELFWGDDRLDDAIGWLRGTLRVPPRLGSR
jgi:2-hydroxychromene-2-carboxylate isomerase